MLLLEFVIVIVTFGAVCIECKSANIDDLPQNVQAALDLLSNNGLMSIGDAAASSPEIFEQIVSYWTQNWKDSHCEWLDEDLPDSIVNQWQYESAKDVITGPLVTWCDIEETFNPLHLSDIEKESVPQHLYEEIAYLLSPEADGNQCLARLKFFVWSIYGIEWNEQFVANLGFNSDMELFMTIGDQLFGLLDAQKLETEKRESSGKREKEQCDLIEPALLMNDFLDPITKIYEQLFNELEGTTITATASFGVRLCYEYEAGLCFGGGFGFAVNAQRNGFLYRESIMDAFDNLHAVQTEFIPNARSKQSEPASTQQPQSTMKPSEPQSTQKQEPEPSMHSTQQTQQTQSTQKQHQEPSIHPTQQPPVQSTQQSQSQSTKNSELAQSTKQSHQEPEPSMHSTMQSPVQPSSTQQPPQSTQKSEPEPSHQPQSTQHSPIEPSSTKQPESTQHSPIEPSQQPPMHSTENKAEARMHATFYIEFGLFDEIEDIHSKQFERELNEKLAGIWIVDPAMVYDEDGNAVGVTFNAEVNIDGHLFPGHPIGSVVLDKVAHLLSDSKEENVMAHIIETKRAFVINQYYPLLFVCAAIGISVVFAAKLYLKQSKKNEYSPLLG